MIKVFIYSLLMILGIVLSQVFDLQPGRPYINFFTLLILGYIMIEVGLEFNIQKGKLKDYGKDYLIAMTAAAFPWIFCMLYFWSFFDISLTKAAIIARFAAPTSAGVLFVMLAAAGLAATWVFKKARILAIFDDLDTILLIIPLQMLHIGFNGKAVVLIAIIFAILFCTYRYLHSLRLPTSRPWLLVYALILTVITETFAHIDLLNLEILLPAFAWGCLLKTPHGQPANAPHAITADDLLKFTYMFFVGCSLPQIAFGEISIGWLVFHVLMLTLLSNLGKLYPMLCYKKEAPFRERFALSVAMWPRGEVGAGILVISMKYAIPNNVIEMAQLSLALNLCLTGVFIYWVMWLLKKPRRKRALDLFRN